MENFDFVLEWKVEIGVNRLEMFYCKKNVKYNIIGSKFDLCLNILK